MPGLFLLSPDFIIRPTFKSLVTSAYANNLACPRSDDFNGSFDPALV